jgi:hypothetical protein
MKHFVRSLTLIGLLLTAACRTSAQAPPADYYELE